MPLPRTALSQARDRRPFGTSRARSGRRQPTYAELSQQESLLRAENEQYGARPIEEDRPGVFRTLVDILSRPNYAIAGATEEVLKGKSVTSAVGRALSEILSGIGPIQGQKKAFGQVLEGQGVGTVTLADAIPALEGTWVGNFGSRGAAGIALDIATDPLTYFSFGTGSALRVMLRSGEHALSAAGKSRYLGLVKRFTDAGDEALVAFDKAKKIIEPEIIDEFGKIVNPDMLEKSGVRFFGKTILETDPLTKRFGESFTAAANAIPGGREALEGAVVFGNGLRTGIESLFSPFGALAGAPKRMKQKAIELHRKFEKSRAAIAGRKLADASEMAKRYRALAKNDPTLGERMYAWREGTGGALSAEEQEIAEYFAKAYDTMYAEANEFGVLADEQLRQNYFAHRYENPPEDFAEVWAGAFGGKAPVSTTPKHTKGRVLDTYADAVDVSKRLNAVSKEMRARGKNVPIYPILEPNYDVAANYAKYVQDHADMVARAAWHEEAVALFGRTVDEFDLDAIYELHKPFLNVVPRQVLLDEISEIQSLLRRSRRSPGTVIAREATDTNVDVIQQASRPTPLSGVEPTSPFVHETLSVRERMKDVNRHLDSLGADGFSPRQRKELAATEKEIAEGVVEAEELDQLKRIYRQQNEDFKRELGELQQKQRELPLQAGRPLTAEQIGRFEERLKNLRDKLASDPVSDENIISNFWNGKTLRGVEREYELPRRVVDPAGKKKAFGEPDMLTNPKTPKGTHDPKVVAEIGRVMNKLKTEEGKREFMRQVFKEATSSAQYAGIISKLDDFADYFPKVRSIQPGELAPGFKFYGEEAKYALKSGALWGDKPVLIPDFIAKDIESVNSRILNTADHKAFGKLIDGFDRFNNLFKLGVYTFWPASAFRDAYSNIALSMLDIGVGALDPKMHLDTIGIMAGRQGELVAKNGVRYSWDSLRKMARDFGVDVPGEVFAELTGRKENIGRAGKALKAVARKRGLIENEARIQLWINHVRRGMDPRDAADRVGEFLFNYGELAPVERELARRMIPFWTFTRKNIELQSKMLKRNPGMVINQLKPFRGQTEENETMAKWQAEGLKIRLDKDGKTVTMLNGIDLPLRNLDTLWPGSFRGALRRVGGMITPVIKTLPEVALGRDFFTGRDMERTTSGAVGRLIEHAPVPMKNWLGYKKEVDDAGRPRYTFDGERFQLVFRSWMFSRLVSTSDRVFREYAGDENWTAALLDFTTGIRYEEYDMNEGMKRKVQSRINQLQESARRRGIQRQYSRTYRSKREADLQ